jgi:flagellar FliJ protein
LSHLSGFDRLKQLALQRRDARAQQLGTLVGEHTEAQAKLALLYDYRRDYQNRLDQATRAGIDGERLRNFRSFLQQLDRAIAQQAEVTAEIWQRLKVVQQQWIEDQRRVDSYQALDERRADASARRDQRHGQKLQDEFAARMRVGVFGGDD